MSNTYRLHALFSGNVQRVGFRWTVVEYAKKHQLLGSVENLSNGKVEVYAYGALRDLEDFLKDLCNSPGFATIAGCEQEIESYENKLPQEFKIIRG